MFRREASVISSNKISISLIDNISINICEIFEDDSVPRNYSQSAGLVTNSIRESLRQPLIQPICEELVSYPVANHQQNNQPDTEPFSQVPGH